MKASEVIGIIEQAFAATPHPGDPFLLGSHDGEEPLQEVSAFYGLADWRPLSPEFLDVHYTALSFFSEGGFRFYLPAYLVADVRDALKTADPVFHLVHGFTETTFDHTIGDRTFTRISGRRQFINPRRHGATTFLDYARYRLSIFPREEAAAIVAYLEFMRGVETRGFDRGGIDLALTGFWRERAATAATAAELAAFVDAQAAYVDAIIREQDTKR